MSDPTPTIKRFLVWMTNHGHQNAVFSEGVLQSQGCQPMGPIPEPGCCSDYVDLVDLAEALKELIV